MPRSNTYGRPGPRSACLGVLSQLAHNTRRYGPYSRASPVAMGPAHSAAFVGGLADLKPTPTPQVHGPDDRQGACYRGHGDYPEEHSSMLSPSLALPSGATTSLPRRRLFVTWEYQVRLNGVHRSSRSRMLPRCGNARRMATSQRIALRVVTSAQLRRLPLLPLGVHGEEPGVWDNTHPW
jgi:hypothetical protein